MTVCAAAKIFNKDGTSITMIASESEVTVIQEKLAGIINDSKLCPIKNLGWAAVAGSCLIGEVLDILHNDPGFFPDLNSKAGIRDFACAFFDTYNEMADCTVAPNDSKDFTSPLLVTTQEKIWAIYSDLSIFEFKESYAVGAGSAVAQGIIHDRLEQLNSLSRKKTYKDLELVLKRAIEVASMYTTGCGGEIKVQKVITSRHEEPVKKPKKKKKYTLKLPKINDEVIFTLD